MDDQGLRCLPKVCKVVLSSTFCHVLQGLGNRCQSFDRRKICQDSYDKPMSPNVLAIDTTRYPRPKQFPHAHYAYIILWTSRLL